MSPTFFSKQLDVPPPLVFLRVVVFCLVLLVPKAGCYCFPFSWKVGIPTLSSQGLGVFSLFPSKGLGYNFPCTQGLRIQPSLPPRAEAQPFHPYKGWGNLCPPVSWGSSLLMFLGLESPSVFWRLGVSLFIIPVTEGLHFAISKAEVSLPILWRAECLST